MGYAVTDHSLGAAHILGRWSVSAAEEDCPGVYWLYSLVDRALVAPMILLQHSLLLLLQLLLAF